MNPTSNPDPNAPAGADSAAGAAPVSPATGAASPAQPVADATSASQPAVNATPQPAAQNPVNPVIAPTAAPESITAAPESITPAPEAVAPAPEAPVVTPANPAINPTAPEPVAPVFNPAVVATPGTASDSSAPNLNGFDPSAPLMEPEPVAPPDPVEQELKAPMQAAAPVPGSIGSAISQPANVAFNDPATEADSPTAGTSAPAENPLAPKKKSKLSFDINRLDKRTLIIVAAIAGVVILVLVIILILMIAGVI